MDFNTPDTDASSYPTPSERQSCINRLRQAFPHMSKGHREMLAHVAWVASDARGFWEAAAVAAKRTGKTPKTADRLLKDLAADGLLIPIPYAERWNYELADWQQFRPESLGSWADQFALNRTAIRRRKVGGFAEDSRRIRGGKLEDFSLVPSRSPSSSRRSPSRSQSPGEMNVVGAETAGVTTGFFTKGIEEEGAMKKCAAAPPPASGPEDIAAWMERYCPNHHEESAARPFAVRMLRHYQSEWWDTPIGNRAGGWGAFMTVDLVANRYTKSADSWRKFRDDLIDKVCRAGLPAELPTGELERESVHCNRCNAGTGNYETSAVMRRLDGRIEVDQCGVCAPGVTA